MSEALISPAEIADEYWYNNKFRYDRVMWRSPLTTENFAIAQIGEIYCRENISPPEHYQLFYELTFAVSGHGICATDGISTELIPNCIYLSRPKEYHKILSDNEDSLRFMCIAFSVTSQKIQTLMDRIFLHYNSKSNRILECAEGFSCMRAILSVFRCPDAFYKDLIDLELQKILYCIARTLPGTQPETQIQQMNSTAFNLISYIDIHFLHIKSVRELSEAFGYDYQYITRLFKKILGVTIGQYITDKKLEYSKLLLTQQNKSVTETAEILGYSIPNNFSRAFKDKFGQTPKAFRRQQTP